MSEEENVAYRALTAPARILVGLRSSIAGKPPDVVSAYRLIVAGIHVTPPKPWPEGGTIDEIADSVLDELLSSRCITQVERDHLCGTMSPRQMAAHGWAVHADVRAARIVKTLYSESNLSAVSNGVRRITQKRNMGPEHRQNVASELIMRAYRHRFSDRVNNAIRSVLQRTITLSMFRSGGWDVTSRDPDEILAGALVELRGFEDRRAHLDPSSDSLPDAIGPDRLELAVLGAYWLTGMQLLKRESGAEKRAGSTILAGMLRSERGLRQLHRVITEGRGRPNEIVAIPLVRPDGTADVHTTGLPRLLTDEELRKTIVPSDSVSSEGGSGIDPDLLPEVQISKGIEWSFLDYEMSVLELERIVHGYDDTQRIPDAMRERGGINARRKQRQKRIPRTS